MPPILPIFLREITPILKRSDINLSGKINSITSKIAPTEISANGISIGNHYKLNEDRFYSTEIDPETGIKTEQLQDKDWRYEIQTIDGTNCGPMQSILAIFKGKKIDEEIYQNGKLASRIEHFNNADLPYRVMNFNPETGLPTKYIQYGRTPSGVESIEEQSYKILPDNSVELTEPFQVNGRPGGQWVDTYEAGPNPANPFNTGHKINQKKYSPAGVVLSNDQITRTSDTAENVIRAEYASDGSGRVIDNFTFTRRLVPSLPKGASTERVYSRYI